MDESFIHNTDDAVTKQAALAGFKKQISPTGEKRPTDKSY